MARLYDVEFIITTVFIKWHTRTPVFDLTETFWSQMNSIWTRVLSHGPIFHELCFSNLEPWYYGIILWPSSGQVSVNVCDNKYFSLHIKVLLRGPIFHKLYFNNLEPWCCSLTIKLSECQRLWQLISVIINVCDYQYFWQPINVFSINKVLALSNPRVALWLSSGVTINAMFVTINVFPQMFLQSWDPVLPFDYQVE